MLCLCQIKRGERNRRIDGTEMDNAIESVEKLDQTEKRLIYLYVARQKNFLRIKIENLIPLGKPKK